MDHEQVAQLFEMYIAADPAKRKVCEAQLVKQFYALATSEAARFPEIDSDDAESDALLAMLKGIRGFDPGRGGKPSTYITTCIRNALKERRAKHHADTVPLEAIAKFCKAPGDEESGYNSNITDLIQRNRAALPPRLIRILRAIYCADSPAAFADIAKQTGKTPRWIQKMVGQALQKLKETK